MGFIRDKSEELTGYQEHAPYKETIDFQNDFVMVYGTDDTMPERIKKFKEKGYVVHLMTGIAWGEYQDYLYGKFDGREHFDEGQRERDGKDISHGVDVPYMVPTIAFANYLTEKLKPAIDSGVVAIHLEEPEFWDRGGYSDAFKREYEIYYKTPWIAPHTSLDNMYKCAKLKAYLYARTIDRIFTELKEYSMIKHGKAIKFYVPTHSLLNYTQWKIMSPEGALIDLNSVDGYIAQVWTGTSRAFNVFEGVQKERTFETAFLEYGIMQELVKGTGRKMWFLHDPIEDNPNYTWDEFEYNYLKTVVASLLHPKISNYEICPWPNRVFNGVYPHDLKGSKTEKSKPIPDSYATLLNNIFNTLADMDQNDVEFSPKLDAVGICMSDTGLFQRNYPDSILPLEDVYEIGNGTKRAEINISEKQMNNYRVGLEWPDFYGIVLPLLKYGLPIRPILLDNIKRFSSYLDEYKTIILSYEFLKPLSPDINSAVAQWVMQGGNLIYVGDGSDPYHKIEGWWNTNKDKNFETPLQHLLLMLGLDEKTTEGTFKIGSGVFSLYDECPALLSLDSKESEKFRNFVKNELETINVKWSFDNSLTLYRGPYIICSVMDEGIKNSKTFEGNFVDIFTPDFKLVKEKTVNPDENCLLYNLDVIANLEHCIIGTTSRIEKLDVTSKGFTISLRGADKVNGFTRLKLPKKPELISDAKLATGEWDEASKTYLLKYACSPNGLEIIATF